jgi:hypothetical protein
MNTSTQKAKPEDPGALEQRRERQRRRSKGKTIGAFAVTAAIGLAAVASSILGALNTTTPAGQTPMVAPGTFSEAQPDVAVTAPTRAGVRPAGSVPVGSNSLSVEGVPFSFSVATSGWERFGSLYISKSTVGPQGAEAVIFWTSFPDGAYAYPCAHLLLPGHPTRPSAADLAAAVSTARGTELIAGPSDVTVGGRAAKHVVLTVLEDVGCRPGYFFGWQQHWEGAFWAETEPGDTIRVWIVDVDGTRLFIEAETTKQAGSDLEQELQQIVESIRFG